jgi:hypothetical protein
LLLGADDFAPADGPVGGWKAVKDEAQIFLKTKNKQGKDTLSFVMIKFITVNGNLIPEHASTKKKTNIPHVHYQYDLNVQKAVQDGVDALFDFYFDAPNKTTRISAGTTQTNCYPTALATLKNGGSYLYWFDSPGQTTGFDDDTKPIATADSQAGDLLLYTTKHASILQKKTMQGYPAQTTYTLRFKNGYSGVYEYSGATALDTPGRKNFVFNDTQNPWLSNRWKEADLSPPRMVRRGN